jgi:sugar phosphate permease
MAHARVPPRIRRVQASALALLVIAGTLNYVDRAALSIANPLIREELGLSIADMGLLLLRSSGLPLSASFLAGH